VAELHGSPSVGVSVISGESRRDDEVAYVREIGLTEAGLVSMSLGGLRLKVVPTLVVVDRSGTVRFASEGVPSASTQGELLSTIRGLAAGR
jgi:hypothetical protein